MHSILAAIRVFLHLSHRTAGGVEVIGNASKEVEDISAMGAMTAFGLENRTLSAPLMSLETITNTATILPYYSRPFGARMALPSGNEVATATRIIHLDAHSRPFNIAGFIVPRVINPIQGMVGRGTSSNLSKKVVKGRKTKFYTFSSVAVVSAVLRIIAATFRRLIRGKLRGFGHAVCAAPRLRDASTTTRYGVLGCKIVSGHGHLRTTHTPASPVVFNATGTAAQMLYDGQIFDNQADSIFESRTLDVLYENDLFRYVRNSHEANPPVISEVVRLADVFIARLRAASIVPQQTTLSFARFGGAN